MSTITLELNVAEATDVLTALQWHCAMVRSGTFYVMADGPQKKHLGAAQAALDRLIAAINKKAEETPSITQQVH